mmetsp:Transcript_61714/g.73232  ORF Transcript_61714/g.73232 Transcript_61714/m.73232 type:complete len:246 (-) Transcript_61714:306-1043(-)
MPSSPAIAIDGSNKSLNNLLLSTTKPFSLTYVRTPLPGNVLSKALAIITLAPISCVVCLTSSYLTRRETFTLLLLFGILCNEILAQVLKRAVKEPRPDSCYAVDFCDSYGMPSSHTQLALFVACFWNLQRARRRRFDNGGRGGDFVEEVLTSLAWLGGVLVGYSRVYLGYHSVRQVIVGGVLGVVFGAVWFELVAVRVASWLFRVGFYEWEVARVLGLRDSSTVGNVVAVEREALMRVVTLEKHL